MAEPPTAAAIRRSRAHAWSDVTVNDAPAGEPHGDHARRHRLRVLDCRLRSHLTRPTRRPTRSAVRRHPAAPAVSPDDGAAIVAGQYCRSPTSLPASCSSPRVANANGATLCELHLPGARRWRRITTAASISTPARAPRRRGDLRQRRAGRGRQPAGLTAAALTSSPSATSGFSDPQDAAPNALAAVRPVSLPGSGTSTAGWRAGRRRTVGDHNRHRGLAPAAIDNRPPAARPASASATMAAFATAAPTPRAAPCDDAHSSPPPRRSPRPP